MQSPSIVPSSEAPSLLQGLQARAHSGLQATVEVVKEQLDVARQAANDRVNVAKAGKRLLDDGGEDAAELVVAKEASLVASDLDGSIANGVQVAIFKLDNSITKLTKLQSIQGSELNSGSTSLPQLASEHEARRATYLQIAQMLETRASSAEMSPEEFDALSIVRAKLGCATMMSTTSQSLASMRQKALAGVMSLREDGADVHTTSETVHAPTLLEALQENTSAGMQKMKQAVNDRVETVKAGKRLLEDGGESAALMVVTKEALLDAADIDRDVAARVQSALAAFDDSAAKLKAVQFHRETGGYLILGFSLAKLAEEHAVRANTYRQIASMLETSVGSMEMDLAERDALSLVRVRDNCGALQCRTNEGFEAITNIAFAGCGSDMDSESRKMRTVCA